MLCLLALTPVALSGGPSHAARATKFVELMAGEDRPSGVEPIASRPVEWRVPARPCRGFGTAELAARVVDAAAVAGAPPREMHLVKGLLRQAEVDALRRQFERLGSAAAVATHARPVVEDGRVVCPELFGLLAAALDRAILPYARARLGKRVVVADALVRAYRHDDRRQALAPHFDLTSYATVIVPLNPGEYGGGLYVQEGADASSRLGVDGCFDKGDVLLHRYDVMHGVRRPEPTLALTLSLAALLHRRGALHGAERRPHSFGPARTPGAAAPRHAIDPAAARRQAWRSARATGSPSSCG